MAIGKYAAEFRARGVRHGMAKLCDDQIRAIRESDETHSKLAKRYEVHFTTISLVRQRETWRHIR